MPQYYHGQRAVDEATGETLVYDARKGWQAATADQSASYKQGRDFLSKEQAALQNYAPTERLMDDASKMLAPHIWTVPGLGMNDGKVNTGGMKNMFGGAEHGTPMMSEDAATFKNLSQQMQIGNKPPAQDAQVTNFERELFASGSPSLRNPTKVNQTILERRKAAMAEHRDKQAFMEQWLNRRGTLDGSETAWKAYTTADPYYGPSARDPSRTTAYVKEPGRWNDYLNKGYRPVPRGTMTKGMTPQQIETRAQFKGAQGQVGTRANPYIPRTRQEYENLPNGAHYIASNGQIAVRNKNARPPAPPPQSTQQPPRLPNAAPQGATKLRWNPQTGEFE